MNKVIAVFANGGTMTTTQTALWQYDYGQILVIQGVQLPTAYEVHFCNSKDSTTITSIGDADGVVIPDQFLQNGEVIYAYVYLHTGDSDGETEYKITIPVMDRAEPTDIEPTPAQESTIGQLISALNDAVDAAEEAASKGPVIQNGYWYIWDSTAGEYVNTNVKAAGIDGTDGNNAWTVDAENTRISGNYVQIPVAYLVGPFGASAKAGDIVFISDGRFTQIARISGQRADTTLIGNLHGAPGAPGEDGYSPEVTITAIEGGHRVTITDEDHPEGQSFDVMDGQGGSGTVDDDFSTTSENPVQNKVITAAFNQAAQQLTNLGLALDGKVDKVSGKSLSSNDFTDSDKDKLDGAASETWVQQQGYITGADLALYRTAAQQDTIDDAQDTAIAAIKGVHWCTYGTTTDVEIQAAIDAGKLPAVNHNNTVFLFHSWDSNSGYTFSSSYIGGSERVACKNGVWSTGDLKFPAAATSAPSDLGAAARGTSDKYARQDHVHKMPSAADVGAVAVAQGVDHAGEFVVVGSDGNITTVTMSVWQGGSY